MNDKGTFIFLYRNIEDWEWYTDANTFRVFVHLLINANIKDHPFKGQIIHRGEFVTSIDSISKKLKLTTQNVRTALKHLELTNEITHTGTPQYSIIRVNNYDFYQWNDKASNKQLTNDQQTANKQLTNDQQRYNNDNKENNDQKRKQKDFIIPSVEEVAAYCKKQGYTVDPQMFVDYYTSNGWMVGKNKMKDWTASVRMWENNKTAKQKVPDVSPRGVKLPPEDQQDHLLDGIF